MANKQFIMPTNRLLNNSNRTASGGTAQLYVTGTLTPAEFLDSDGVSLGHTLTADGIGQLPNAYQDEATPFRLILKDRNGATLDGGDIDPFYFGFATGATGLTGPAGDVASVATRSAIKLLAGSAGLTRYLKETGREGIFMFDTSDLSAMVAADPNEGIYVAGVGAGASGAWVRKFTGPIQAKWFGGAWDGTTDDSATVLAVVTLANAMKSGNVTGYGYATPSIELPFASNGIYMGTTTLSLTNAVRITGSSNGSFGGEGTLLKWDAGCNGIEIRAANCILERLALKGGWVAGTTAEGEYHAIKIYFRPILRDLFIMKWQGDGIYCYISAGSGGDTEGNANGIYAEHVSIINCRNGVYIRGADSNAGNFIAFDVAGCRQSCVYDRSFLGNTWTGLQTTDGGVTDIVSGVPPVCVYNNGFIFACIPGQETGASTNSPPSTATSNTWWLYWKASGAATAYAPQWVSGTTYRSGGAVTSDRANGQGVYTNIYSESDQPPIQLGQADLVVGYQGAMGPNTRAMTTNSNGTVFNTSTCLTGNVRWWPSAGGATLLMDGTKFNQLPEQRFLGSTSGAQISFYNSSGTQIAYVLSTDTNNLYLNATAGVILRFNATNVAKTSTGGIDLYTGKVLSVNGTQVVTARQTGWTAGTGTPNVGAFAAYAGGTRSATYVQAEAQATDDAAKAASQRILAIEAALRTHGLIN